MIKTIAGKEGGIGGENLFRQAGDGVAVGEEKGVDMEVLENELLDELSGLCHLLLCGEDGNIQVPGDLFIAFSLAAGEVDVAAGGRQTVYGGLKEFLVLPVLYPVIGIVDCGARRVPGEVDEDFLFGGLLFKPVIDMVAGKYKKVILKIIDGVEALSFLPDLHKYLLNYFARLGMIFEEDHGDIEDLRRIMMIELRVGGLIAGADAY